MSSVPARRRSVFPDLSELFDAFPVTGFRPPFGGNLIRVEDRVENDRYILRAELPGLDPENDIKVSVADGQLTIEAERSEEKSEGGRSEFSYGSFSRTVALPAGADEEKVDASYSKGILEVTVGLTAKTSGAKQIQVKPVD
ncbi:Hsp20/alpha crystallin family protein [Rhodococcus sp. TAF43]|uniref:Hsp20/alpha crystallin family protein n=1 Tax=unclassified Rhodococcus (in: high G+C Gram-positive bacteria) TaxID=192944 RepID=UPI000E0B9FC1|nr:MULTISPECIES: Hsp20/alpha crystallin family protein [unclassified Rhodococcus (in: high G+C Gram-positive bacteria)]RDI23227.1 HSP20 family molecular chaperone IbpA [Rhodococcus sp. AG1013]